MVIRGFEVQKVVHQKATFKISFFTDERVYTHFTNVKAGISTIISALTLLIDRTDEDDGIIILEEYLQNFVNKWIKVIESGNE